MRRWWPVLTLFLSACGLKRLLPEGPVLTEDERAAAFPIPPSPSGATYTGPPRAAFPIPPVVPWAAAYDLDIVLVTDHPSWDMHEIARVRAPDGPIWLAKDARAGTLEQSLVLDLEAPYTWLPEIPVVRRSAPLRVEDRSTGDRLDVDVFYENVDGEPVHISYQGPVPRTELRKRNGSTMGHSRDTLLAVLDLPRRDLGRSARVRIGGERRRIRRIAGLVPFRMALVQTQAGLATADLEVRPAPPPFADAPLNGIVVTHHLPDGVTVAQPWQVARTASGVELVQRSDLRTIRHTFMAVDDALEWTGATVTQWGIAAPTFRIAVQPALPDLRRPFEGTRTSRFVLDVGGGRSHAVGAITARWEGETPVVEVRPEAPWWVTDRPLRTTVRFDDPVRIEVVRIP